MPGAQSQIDYYEHIASQAREASKICRDLQVALAALVDSTTTDLDAAQYTDAKRSTLAAQCFSLQQSIISRANDARSKSADLCDLLKHNAALDQAGDAQWVDVLLEFDYGTLYRSTNAQIKRLEAFLASLPPANPDAALAALEATTPAHVAAAELEATATAHVKALFKAHADDAKAFAPQLHDLEIAKLYPDETAVLRARAEKACNDCIAALVELYPKSRRPAIQQERILKWRTTLDSVKNAESPDADRLRKINDTPRFDDARDEFRKLVDTVESHTRFVDKEVAKIQTNYYSPLEKNAAQIAQDAKHDRAATEKCERRLALLVQLLQNNLKTEIDHDAVAPKEQLRQLRLLDLSGLFAQVRSAPRRFVAAVRTYFNEKRNAMNLQLQKIIAQMERDFEAEDARDARENHALVADIVTDLVDNAVDATLAAERETLAAAERETLALAERVSQSARDLAACNAGVAQTNDSLTHEFAAFQSKVGSLGAAEARVDAARGSLAAACAHTLRVLAAAPAAPENAAAAAALTRASHPRYFAQSQSPPQLVQ